MLLHTLSRELAAAGVGPEPHAGTSVRSWRAAIALDTETFVPFCLHWDDRRWWEFLTRYQSIGLTHVYVQLRGRYPEQGDFDLRSNLALVEARLRELRERRLVPILWASAGEWHGDRPREILRDWRDMLAARPVLRPLLPVVVPGPEFDDYLSEDHQQVLVEGLSRLFPDSYMALHFTPGKVDTHLIASHREGVINAVAYNMPPEERDNRSQAVDALKRVSRLVTGTANSERDTENASDAGLDCILGEFGAYDVLRGRRTFEAGDSLRRDALSLAGITGVGD